MIDEQLIIRFLSQECTRDELDRIDQWISQDKAHAEWLFEMERMWMLKDEWKYDEKKIKNAYRLFQSNLDKNNPADKHVRKVRYTHLWWSSAAAVIILLLCINLFLPKTNHFRLTQSDNVVEVPKGQRVSLTLSDGTKVHLNSDSKLTYPALFTNKTRTVELEGEGYFEVIHNDKTPFIVMGHDLNVKVLGTTFNMKTFPGEMTSVVLLEGKIEVYTHDYEHKVILHPDERVDFTSLTGMVVYKNIDTTLESIWTEGELAFNEETLENIMKILERKFSIKTSITDEKLAKLKFKCRINSDANIIEVLNVLRNSGNFDYVIQNGIVTIF